MNDSFCSLLWMGLSINTKGHVVPCCVSSETVLRDNGTPYKISEDSIDKIMNGEFMKEVRRKMLRGEKIPGCSYCYEVEKNGSNSNRIFNNNRWPISPESEIVDSSSVSFLDIRLGNLCNLACRTCSPDNSNRYAQELLSLQESGMSHFHSMNGLENDYWFKSQTFVDNVLSQIHSIRDIYVAGGEPSINKELVKLLDKFIETGASKDVVVTVNTNIAAMNPLFYDTLAEFKSVNLFVSIDGTEGIQEYLRYPSKWSRIDKNLRYLVEQAKFNIFATPVIQIGNLHNIASLLEYLESFNREAGKKVIDVLPIDLEQPEHHNIKYLPGWYKEKHWNSIEDWFRTKNKYLGDMGYGKFESVKTKCLAGTVADNTSRLRDHLTFSALLDEKRGMYLKEYIPTLFEVMNDPVLWS